MSDIDLIPNAYRVRRWQSLWLIRSAGILAGFACLVVAGLYVLGASTAKAKTRVEILQQQQAVSALKRSEIQRLSGEKEALEEQFKLLSGLRSSAAAEDMFLIVDRALTGDDVWFLDWNFQRAGVEVGEAAGTINTGYFIVVPADGKQSSSDTLQVQTNMTIRGQASDHSALSRFVRRLFEQKEIDDVRIRRTNVSRSNGNDVVDFDLAVVLKTVARD